ncbi:MAG: DNA mismatch repair protein MutS [Synergistaceae bacterium]|nr:DNA mismatch repair protein MutS [Synergistaceae bacterium]
MSIPSDVKITPWLGQYKKFKDEYPDAILLFRMGDFYEMFFDDARKAASILDIALTARDTEKKIPMAGIPHHALNVYLGRLIKAGLKAAICEQISEPDPKKGIVDRKVIRVVTPGTYVPDDGLAESGHLAAVWPLKNFVAMALLSVNTGMLEAGTLTERDAAAMLTAFSPGEVLYPSSMKLDKLPGFLKAFNLVQTPTENFKIDNAAGKLKAALKARRLAGFGIDEKDPCVGSAWAALDYLSATQFSSLNDVLKFSPLMVKDRMSLDAAAQRNLELIPETSQSGASLLTSLDRCRTPMGRRRLRDWLLRPLMDVEAIKRRQNAIKILVEARSECSALQDRLAGTRDVERALSRLALGTGNPQDLGAVRDTLRLIPDIKNFSFDEPLNTMIKTLPDMSELASYLESSLVENLPRVLGASSVIRPGFSAELDEWRGMSERGERWLAEYLEREREATATPKLKTGYTNAFGYYLEAGKNGLAIQPEYFKQTQTLVNARRYTTPELKNFEAKMRDSASEISRLESALYAEVVAHVLEHSESLQLTGRLLGMLDCAASCAMIARERSYVCPVVDTSDVIKIKGGRHPVIEAEMKDANFVPNDVELDSAGRVIILTGPNMAGKSTWLRMTALLAIMAQAGLWIPAESARFGLVDRVFTRIGARDDLVRGSSTFMIEMLETANILNNVTDKSLIILDEIGRGTATWDGMSIAWAVLEYLQGSCKARVLFATHCHELTCLEERLEGVKNYSMAVSEGKDGILFLHQVVKGPADRSYGIEVARLAGLPDIVLRRAFELLEIFEREGFEVKELPAPLPQIALKRQIMMFSPEADGTIEEIAALDVNNMTPVEALNTLSKLVAKSLKIVRR